MTAKDFLHNGFLSTQDNGIVSQHFTRPTMKASLRRIDCQIAKNMAADSSLLVMWGIMSQGLFILVAAREGMEGLFLEIVKNALVRFLIVRHRFVHSSDFWLRTSLR